jgi:phage FluMu gp28-like protein
MDGFFLPYQSTWILDPARYKIYVKSRQIGITFAEAFWSFTRRLTKRIDHHFSSANYKTSKEFITYVKQFADATNISLGYEMFRGDAFGTEEVRFPNGSKIIVCTSNPTALRGFKGDVTWDEAAWHEHAEDWYTAATPVTTWGGDFHIISTPSGEGSVFSKLLRDAQAARNKFKVFSTDINQAVAQGLAEKVPGDHQLILDQETRRQAFVEGIRANCLSDALWEQEYCCKAMGSSSIILPDKYDKCIIPNFTVGRLEFTPPPNCGRLFAGIDIGRTNDATAISIVEEGVDLKQVNPHLRRIYRTIFVRTLKDCPFDAQFEILCNLTNSRLIQKVYIESNGIGMTLGEQLYKKYHDKVYQWNTNGVNKASIAERLAGFVSQERISLPADGDIREDILSMRRVTNSNGKLSYEGGTKNNHADCFISLALALAAAEEQNSGFLQVHSS